MAVVFGVDKLGWSLNGPSLLSLLVATCGAGGGLDKASTADTISCFCSSLVVPTQALSFDIFSSSIEVGKILQVARCANR